MKVLFFIPATLLPMGNTQASNGCTQLGKTFSKKFEKPLDKPHRVWYNEYVRGREQQKLQPTRNRHPARNGRTDSSDGKAQTFSLI